MPLHNLLQQLLYDKAHPLLFNHGFFVYLFCVFIVLYYWLRNHVTARTWLFCLFSLYFFYKASGFFVVFVVVAAMGDYVLSNWIAVQANAQKKKLLLVLSIVLNVGLLFYFKYTNFFIALLQEHAGLPIHPLHILLPVGISFYTFENISYTIDVYRGEIAPVKKFSSYLLFLSFFPKLVMGPIVRAKDFIPQIEQPYTVSANNFYLGFYWILGGLFKKLIISDYLTLNYVNFIFDAPDKHTGLECLVAVYAYAIVIYCDFSGYSSVAIGIAKWLGYDIPPNFLSPYQSKDITEFWRRWHISLSNWLRDYLYIPMGGNRKGKWRTYAHLMITMLLGGLWHGASFNFIVWGGLHGIALAVHKFWKEKTGALLTLLDRPVAKWVSVLLTFHFVCFCWIFFKANNMHQAWTMIEQIVLHFKFAAVVDFCQHYTAILLFIALGYLLHALPEKMTETTALGLQKAGMVSCVVVFLVFVIVYGYFKSATPVLPIYLQF